MESTLEVLACVPLGLPNGQRWCRCNTQSITANPTWYVTHNEISEPRLNGASLSTFVEWEPGVWSLSTVLHSSFFSRQAGNWTWNLSSCYLANRLCSQLKWIQYHVRDERYMSVCILYLSHFLLPSLTLPALWAGWTCCRCLWGKSLF